MKGWKILLAVAVVGMFIMPISLASAYYIGIEWVNNYSWPTPDLHYCDDDARVFRDKILTDSNWFLKFEKSNSGCKDEHWQYQDDENYVDNVHFSYYSGHGNDHELVISTYWEHAEWDNCKWGDERNGRHDWTVLSCCEAAKEKFSHALRGIHLILGWKTTCIDTNYGSTFATGMIDYDWTIKASWFYAGDIKGSSWDIQRVLGENIDMGNDHLYGHGYVNPDPEVDDYYVYWDNTV